MNKNTELVLKIFIKGIWEKVKLLKKILCLPRKILKPKNKPIKKKCNFCGPNKKKSCSKIGCGTMNVIILFSSLLCKINIMNKITLWCYNFNCTIVVYYKSWWYLIKYLNFVKNLCLLWWTLPFIEIECKMGMNFQNNLWILKTISFLN